MVRVPSDERSVGESPERSALVLPLLIGHERLLEDMSVIALLAESSDLETSVRSMSQGMIDKFKVINAPHPAISERAVTVLKHPDVRAVEISCAYIFRILLAMEVFRHARIGRIVVHVTHADYLYAGIFLHHLHRMVIHDLAATVAKLVAALLVTGT